jgi:hypothetical protein
MITPTVELALLSLYVYAVGDELNRPKIATQTGHQCNQVQPARFQTTALASRTS